MKIAVACGGTGGHIYPGVATGERLAERGHEVTLWLGGRDVEALSAQRWSGPVERVTISARRSGVLGAVSAVLSNAKAVAVCRRRMRAACPDLVLGMGGYASAPPVLGARLCGATVVLHESNAVPGRATTFLARFAHAVALGFQEAEAHLGAAACRVVGFPLRRDFLAPPAESAAEIRTRCDLDPDCFTLFVMGGSQGASFLNDTVPALFAEAAEQRPVQVIHISGAGRDDALRARYAELGVPAHVVSYSEDVHSFYSAADLAVSRAGSATCAELIATGLHGLLVPIPHALRDHQTANASAMVRRGHATLFAQPDFDSRGFIDAIRTHARAPADASALRMDAADALCDYVEETAARVVRGNGVS